MIKSLRKFTSKIYELQGDLLGNLRPREGLCFRMNTLRFMKFNRSLLNIQSCMFSKAERNSLRVDMEALHEAAQFQRQNDFINLLPLLRREKATLQIAKIIGENIERKNDGHRVNLTLPILTQTYGAGKTVFMMNLPKLFETYCPKNKELKEAYHIYVNLKKLPLGQENVLDRLHSLIFSSFLEKYEAVPEKFPLSLDRSNINLLGAFITEDNFTGKFKKLLIQLKVREDKINHIIKDMKDKKYSLIIFEIDELRMAENEEIYSEREKDSISNKIDCNKSNTNMDQNNLSNLIRLYRFCDLLDSFMRISYFEVIASGKGTSCLLGNTSPYNNPTRISQIILDPLTREDIKAILDVVLLKSNMIDKEVNLEKITEEIYGLTAGHPLYVGISIYYYYISILNKNTKFNLEIVLKEDKKVQTDFSKLIDNVKMYKNVLGLEQFFYDILNGDDMHKETNYVITKKRGQYIQTLELLDNLGISYSNEKDLIIKPILPGIFRKEFEAAVEDNFEYQPKKKGMHEKTLFEESFLNFSRRNKHLKPDTKYNFNIKKMFSFLKRFPDFLETHPFPDEISKLPRITKSTDDIPDEECYFSKLKRLCCLKYTELLSVLGDNFLFRHRESSYSCDFIFKQKIDEKNKLFLLFLIKNSTTSVDLIGEYNKVFNDTELQLGYRCLYRLIIFNSAETKEITFDANEAYKVYYWDNGKLKPLLEDYEEMDKPILMYYVNPSEVQRFLESKVKF